ncbi:MAG TPA: SAM-dependent methyltransferase [Isosphaeraceae bacterium]|nr:SAM-dependent methyltransferase [Isosphaeraceae bacterium]
MIYLVGLGPGDTDLVTLKAARLLKDADRVYCFDFLREEVARFARPEALTVVSPLLMGRSVAPGAEGLTPELSERARQAVRARAEFVSQVRALVNAGRTVVFADSGDPTLFSPWFWIERAFAELRIEVVPGASSFNAANAVLHLGVTVGSEVSLSAGTAPLGSGEECPLPTTRVIFTHRFKARDVLPQLAARYPADTPVALVCEASRSSQEVITGTVGTVLDKINGRDLPHLYVIDVGDGLVPAMSARSGCPVDPSDGPTRREDRVIAAGVPS